MDNTDWMDPMDRFRPKSKGVLELELNVKR